MNTYIFECPPMDNDPSVIVIVAETTEEAMVILKKVAHFPGLFNLEEIVTPETKAGVIYHTHTIIEEK